jgi:hypothetical protein
MRAFLHPNSLARTGYLKWLAIVCSLPSWIFFLSLFVYRFWLDGSYWPRFEWLIIPFCICVLCSLVSMTMFLILLDSSSAIHAEIYWFFWATFPIIAAMFLGFMLWLSVTFGRASIYDYFGRY